MGEGAKQHICWTGVVRKGEVAGLGREWLGGGGGIEGFLVKNKGQRTVLLLSPCKTRQGVKGCQRVLGW